MKRVAQSAGFTIVETMIVLAVTGLLFAAVAGAWGGKQHISEYQTAIRDVRTRVQQSISDVENGYFPDTSGFVCTAHPTTLDFSNIGAKAQGTNSGCIFLGKALQFKIRGSSPEQVKQYTVAGRAAVIDSEAGLAGAAPTLAPHLTETLGIPTDLQTVKIKASGRSTPYRGLVFMSDLGSHNARHALESGRQTVRVYGLTGDININNDPILADGSDAGVPLPYDPDPITSGIQICLKSGGTKNYALLTIAANGTTTDVRAETKQDFNCGI